MAAVPSFPAAVHKQGQIIPDEVVTSFGVCAGSTHEAVYHVASSSSLVALNSYLKINQLERLILNLLSKILNNLM